MEQMFRSKLSSPKVYIRVLYFSVIFFILFFGLAVISYFVLPEGILRNQNQFKSFEISSNLMISSLQIFAFNMISVVFVMIGSLFAKKGKEEEEYLSLGYMCFLVFIAINAVTLGTWSFSTQVQSVSLPERLLGMFRVTENAGMVEMFGQLLITCALANKYLVMTCKNVTKTRKASSILWAKQDILCFVLGLLAMFLGAVIESRSILAIG